VTRALGVEWLKLRTVRSTTWSLLSLAGFSVLFTALTCFGSTTQGGSPGRPGDNDIVLDSLSGLWFGQIAAAALAVLAITSEYSTRMIRTTLAALPRRGQVLTAKTLVVGVAVLAAGLATSAACFQVGQWGLRGGGFTYENGYPAATLTDAEPLRAVVGAGVYLTLLAVVAVGIGAIVRHTAGAITLVLAVVLGPVIAFNFLPERIGEWFERLSLMGAGIAMSQTVERSDSIPLEPWEGLAVVAAYAAATFALALWAIRARDA
jgi:ABC-2 type transport system permease protein